MLVSNTQVNMCKKLEETKHVHVRLLSRDSTFDLFNFFPNFFFQNSGCGLSASAAYTLVFTVYYYACNPCLQIQLYFDFDLLFHNHFMKCHCFWLRVHGFNFPNERLCPSTLMQMFRKSEIVLVE